MGTLLAVRQLAWVQHPMIWLCGTCAILFVMLRAVRSPLVRCGALLVLCGLLLNGLVTSANAGTMPVIGMPATSHPADPIWQAATPETRLPLLADHASLRMFSIGDLLMLFGGSLVVAICLRRRTGRDGGWSHSRTTDAFQYDSLNALTIKRQGFLLPSGGPSD